MLKADDPDTFPCEIPEERCSSFEKEIGVIDAEKKRSASRYSKELKTQEPTMGGTIRGTAISGPVVLRA